MAPSRGSLTDTTYDSWNVFTNGVSAPSSTSTGATTSQTLKCFNKQGSPVSRPCWWKHSYAGQGTSPEWRITAYPRSSSTVNSPPGTVTEEHQRRGTKTLWKNPCLPATSTIDSGQPLLLTEGLGDMPFTSQSPPLRATVGLPSRRSAVGGRTVSPQH